MKKYSNSAVFAMALAAFMVLIMVISPLAAYFWGSDDDAADPAGQTDLSTTVPTPDNRRSLGEVGQLINHPFDSIADGLAMSPPGVVIANYVCTDDLEGTPMEPLIPTTQQHDLYGTDISKAYRAAFWDNTQIEMDKLSPRKFDFGLFIRAPTPYKGYHVLIRNKDMCSILGDPCILGPRSKVEATVDVIDDENASNSYPPFSALLEQVDLDAPYQVVAQNSRVASQYYDAVRVTGDSCERTITCIGITENTTVCLNKLAANTTDSLECNMAFDQGDLNFTIARITGDFDAVMDVKCMKP
ncbi:MAG: hypothetical protein EF813_12295 [Methanosarcinales archaeon]|nr:MAG: hypothetical protein EF813_12295 [Methanosarcinales archaeon]